MVGSVSAPKLPPWRPTLVTMATVCGETPLVRALRVDSGVGHNRNVGVRPVPVILYTVNEMRCGMVKGVSLIHISSNSDGD